MAEDQVAVKTTRFEDRGIGPGGSDYLGWIFEVAVLGTTFWFRQYEDEPEQLDLMAWDRDTPGERHRIRGGVPIPIPPSLP